jgi:acyl carrier protein
VSGRILLSSGHFWPAFESDERPRFEDRNRMPNSIDNVPLGGPAVDGALMGEIAALMVSALNLDLPASAIDPDAPLYKEGLGLDSIDILEVALVVSRRYGFKLREDDRDNLRIFSSLRSLASHVAERRTK